jgi:hypothetical protein
MSGIAAVVAIALAAVALSVAGAYLVRYVTDKAQGRHHAPDFRERKRTGKWRSR